MTKVNAPEDAEVIFQKLYSDMGIHRNPRKGTLKASDAILENYDFSREVLVDEVFPDEFSLEETQNRIEKNTRSLIDYGKPVISIGGDHSVSFPVIKALKEENPDLKLIWLDSHLDLKEKVGDHVSHDVVVRELLDTGYFEEDEIIFLGITRTDKDEKSFIEDHDLKIYGYDELEGFLEDFNGADCLYLSIDIDVLQEKLAPGTGYPDGEMALEQVKNIIQRTKPDFADLVEVSPPLDKDQETVESARKILSVVEEVIGEN